MHPYEKTIAEKMNGIAGKDIYFDVDKIMSENDDVRTKIIGLLVESACCYTNVLPITIARDCLKQFPKDWVCEKIRQTVFDSINVNDYWDYRRLLELSKIISDDLLKWALSLGKDSDDIDIIEAVEDFS